MPDSKSLLAKLIGFHSVVGQPNSEIIDFVRNYVESYGLTPHVIAGPDPERSNLFVSIGPLSTGGIILSAHLDVVPADEPDWKADPFSMRQEGDALIGRGACDMKGFAAVVLASIPKLAVARLKRPVHIAFSYDEEAGCLGVPHLIAAIPGLCEHAPIACIVGEPTGLHPVLRHKGKCAARIRAVGVTGHSSRPDLGKNAIHLLTGALNQVLSLKDKLQSDGPFDDRFSPNYSTIQVGRIGGGRAVNVIPDHAEADIEIRTIPGVSAKETIETLIQKIQIEAGLLGEIISSYPPLSLDAESPLAKLATEISGKTIVEAVSFGTEGGLFESAGIPTVICGPGDVRRAHKSEEFIRLTEMNECDRMIERLACTLC